ncbi:MAG: aldo/keto reductase [Sphaerochaetaceae bacterium]|nr:aldo/keto reductase [Sphaerochaetaceae bacterium]
MAMAIDHLILGTWALSDRHWPNQLRSDSIKTIHAALKGGFRHFDTANSYGNGLAEQLLGQQLKRFYASIGRENLSIASKIAIPVDYHGTAKLIEKTLRRMCLTYLDVLYIHWPSSTRPVEPVLDEIMPFVENGRIRSIGLSNFPLSSIERLTSEYPIRYCQFPLSLIWRRSFDSIGSLCKRLNLTAVAYSPLGFGSLSDKHPTIETFSSEDWRRDLYCYKKPYIDVFLTISETLRQSASSIGMAPSAVAVAWCLSKQVDFIIFGARNRQQVEQLVHSLSVQIPEEMYNHLDQLSKELDALVDKDIDNPFFHRW